MPASLFARTQQLHCTMEILPHLVCLLGQMCRASAAAIGCASWKAAHQAHMYRVLAGAQSQPLCSFGTKKALHSTEALGFGLGGSLTPHACISFSSLRCCGSALISLDLDLRGRTSTRPCWVHAEPEQSSRSLQSILSCCNSSCSLYSQSFSSGGSHHRGIGLPAAQALT